MEFGPGLPTRLSKSSLDFMRQCSNYIAKLSLFDKYLIFRYTIGSASVNTYLIFNKLSENSIYWTYLFCKYWSNTATTRVDQVPKDFKIFMPYFREPEALKKAKKEVAMVVSHELIAAYIVRLQSIIKRGPATTEDIVVYKVANPYPGLPEKGTGQVLQLPFNSTTLSNDFNFYIFTNPANHCCFFKITIPPGQHVLSIPSQYHAYPFENEVLLGPGVTFNITNITNGVLRYIEPKDINMTILQDKDKIVMGPVFDYDIYEPCKGKCVIQSKSFKIYETILK